MAFPTGLPKVRDHREHFNERPGMCYHQAPPLVRVVVHVGDAGQATPHLEHNPLSLLGACHAMPLRKLNDPGLDPPLLDNCTAPRFGVELPTTLTCYKALEIERSILIWRASNGMGR